MDRPSTEEEARIQELIRLSEASRTSVGLEILDLKRKLDVPLRIKHSLRSKPTTWLAGSAAAGVFTSLIFRRKSKSKSPKRTNALLGLTLTAARPLVKVWLGNKFRQWATTAIHRQQVASTNPFKQNPDTSRSHVSTSGPRPR